jgi:hypothetical protein
MVLILNVRCLPFDLRYDVTVNVPLKILAARWVIFSPLSLKMIYNMTRLERASTSVIDSKAASNVNYVSIILCVFYNIK